jgi:pimeloyl-ACP methyl ester carboxylesterase
VGRRLGAGIAALALAGCGGGGGSTTSVADQPVVRPAAHTVDGCLTLGAHARRVRVPHTVTSAVRIGTGRRAGVVFANQSGGNICGWVPLARALARRGATAVLYDGMPGDPAGVAAAVRTLRRAGLHRVVVVGASVGGRAVVQLAARRTVPLDAVISLSAERLDRSTPDLIHAARRVRTPSFYVSSKADGYTSFAQDTRQLYAATPARDKRILVVPGDAHGTDLLPQARVREAVVRAVFGR